MCLPCYCFFYVYFALWLTLSLDSHPVSARCSPFAAVFRPRFVSCSSPHSRLLSPSLSADTWPTRLGCAISACKKVSIPLSVYPRLLLDVLLGADVGCIKSAHKRAFAHELVFVFNVSCLCPTGGCRSSYQLLAHLRPGFAPQASCARPLW